MGLLDKLFPTSRTAPLNAAYRQSKASEVYRTIVVGGPGQPRWTEREYEPLMREGYEQNDVVYACVRYIIDGFIQLPISLYQKKQGSKAEEVTTHRVMDLLATPNELMSEADFREAWGAFLLLAGNSFVHGVPPGEMSMRRGEPQELWALRPDKVKVLTGTWMDPIAGYLYTESGQEELPAEEVGHTKLFHPLDHFYGMSPLEAAARGVDQNNAAGAWNAAMLQNGAAPRSIINLRGTVSNEKQQQFKEGFREHMTGTENARRTMIVRASDGIDYVQLALNALEMDWVEGTKLSARQICRAYRVPGQLVDIPDSQTYANYEQAEVAGWTGAILPLAVRYCDFLTRWLLPKFDKAKGLYLWFDDSGVIALQKAKLDLRRAAYEGFREGIYTQRQAAQLAGADDSFAQDLYVWDLRRTTTSTPESTNALMQRAKAQFGPRVMAALRAVKEVN